MSQNTTEALESINNKCLLFLLLSGKMIFLFPENMILLFRQRMKDHICHKNTWKYDIFCIFGKDGISFSDKYDITFSQKRKDDPLPKNALKDDISGIIENDDILPRKHGSIILIFTPFFKMTFICYIKN